ncbi:MAG: DegT/DnrJ/EryC1/StrS aminotransferase family protein [Deltaproteobacteria bacterium]|jgi:dTDP-4-amino-4,6-dideoxygalactose transaminase|nr:DegT/DnrJ/EryC1/StrS aminotransferase family protein [Deltaproteobacteria bacterium]
MAVKPLATFTPFAPPLIDEREIEAVASALQSGWLTRGPRCELFEAEIAEYLGAAGALAVSSCTAALHLAHLTLNLGPGQGVITSPLTFVSTAHAIVYCGARPFLVDIDPTTGNLDPNLVRKFLTEECRLGGSGQPIHKETSLTITAISPVHYGGWPADLEAFWRLAQEFNLALVEDAAHALGTTYNHQLIGNPSLRPNDAPPGLVCFSFYATKNLATGEGGLLVASDPELLERARILSAYGISDARKIWGRYAPQGTWVYDVAELGHKYNFTDIQAALGLAQLEKLPQFLADRRERAQIWLETLAPLGDLVILPKDTPETAWHLFPLRLNLLRLKANRDQIFQSLRDLNIGASVMFIPLHAHSYYRQILGYPWGALPLAENFFAEEISLPISPAVSLSQIEAAATATKALLAELAL